MERDDDPVEAFRAAAAKAGSDLRPRSFGKGEPIFEAGLALGGIHIVTCGLVASRMLLENGREVLIGLHGRGETLGDLEYCMGCRPVICGVTALEPAATLWADAAALDAMVRADPAFAMSLARVLAERLYRSSLRLSAGLAYPLEYSLLKAVLARLDSPDDARPLSKRELVEYLGHTERHVNRLLRSLEDAGVLSVDEGSVAVVDARLARRRMERLER
jgi:CRP-like cAMP-binding protein